MSFYPTCTSSTRPSNPLTGDTQFETDTKNIIVWDGTNWRGYQNDGVAIPVLSNSFSTSFDGTDDYLNVGQISTLAGASAQTVSFWFKGATDGELPDWGFRDAAYSGGSQFDGRKVTVSGIEGYYIDVRNGASFYIQFSFADLPNDILWHNYVVTYNAGTIAFYVDGSEVTTGTPAGTAPTSLASTITDFSIGRMGQDNTYCAGNFDEFAMWDVALDSSNVAQLYNLGRPFDLSSDAGNYNTSADLTHWWRMGDFSSDTSDGGGAAASGSTVGTVVNLANSGTNDATVGGGAPAYSNSTPSS